MGSYVSYIVYQEHYTLDGLCTILDQFRAPYVVSPLHTPEGRKAHYHVIIDNSETAFNSAFLRTMAVLLHSPNNSWQDVRNVRRAEMYLRHETADSCNKQQFKGDEVCTFGNGYKLHENTYVGKREEVSSLVTYISDRLVLYCRSTANISFMELWDMVKKPEFYDGFETCIPFKSCVGKALNEIKLHYNFYAKLNEQATKNIQDELTALDEIDNAKNISSLKDYITSKMSNLDDEQMHCLIYNLYGNNKRMREFIKVCGGLKRPRDTFNSVVKGLKDMRDVQLVIDYLDKFNAGVDL